MQSAIELQQACVRLTTLMLAVLWPLSAMAEDIHQARANSDAYADVTRNVDPDTQAKGAALYTEHCAQCHDRAVPRAPQRFILAQLTPDSILSALNDGIMQGVASGIPESGRVAIAEFLTQRKLDNSDPLAAGVECAADRAAFDRDQPPGLPNWGFDDANSHHIGSELHNVGAADLKLLEPAWAFAFPSATRARSQPVIAGGAVFVGSHKGIVYAFDLETGCTRWQFVAGAEVRTGMTLQTWEAGDDDAQPLLFFGDLTGHQYALDAFSGELVWRKRMDEHPGVTLTASAVLQGDTLYVPLSSLEVGAAIDPEYQCCSFRGAVVAVEASTGEELWRAHWLPPAQPLGANPVGTPRLGPSGAPVWNSPAFWGDYLYVGTGENYSSPATDTSDSVIAVNRHSGEIEWVYQAHTNDAWNASCEEATRYNCPEEDGPDYDFGAAPVIAYTEEGEPVLVAGGKSGLVVGLKPDTGELLWKNKVGRGGVVAGVHFGIATFGGRVFVPISDAPDGKVYDEPARPGMYALDARTGKYLWRTPSPTDICQGRPGCFPGYSGAISVTDDYVLAGSNDGFLRAYDVRDGTVIWRHDTTETVLAVGGREATGGSMGGGSAPLVYGDYLITNSGYAFAGKMPGNALLVFRKRR
ncbi:pyrrolo-quinoline quinone [Luminiphilus syltensis NOR5-1B]|uniref:Pyrrolo-quinoline quinone n=1 Tax=Luminiphilus syltensis NOR5-1B TaxID=565045 RepID=B8KSQ7_9GAMM|nr:PQQ-binding-like beta-propeller repeat protein [Luminiphilus syltensis]EED36698.1 pyrrolo-quinoline quinone [Luminiphilus syltensis NOR5-1B]